MFQKLKQIKDLRDKAKTIQSALEQESAEGTAAWGKVKITIDGTQKVKAVEIDDAMLAEKAKLEEAVREALNDAQKKIQSKVMGVMKTMGGDLGLPGM
jgi:DNA-binding YbaB/EbfC family protein